MEYSVKDMFRILVKKWYWILLSAVVAASVAGGVSQASYSGVLRQYEELTTETYPVDSLMGSVTAQVRIEVEDPTRNIGGLLQHPKAVQSSSVLNIRCVQLDEASAELSMEEIDLSSAQQCLREYLDILNICADEYFSRDIPVELEEFVFLPSALKPTARARTAQIVMAKPAQKPQELKTMVKAMVYGTVLACVVTVWVTMIKEPEQAEKGKDHEA